MRKDFRIEPLGIDLLPKAQALAYRASDVQELEPNGAGIRSRHSLGLNQPVAIVGMQTVSAQDVGGIFKSAKLAVAIEETIVFLGFLAFPNALFPIGMVAIVVILVNGTNRRRDVDQQGSRGARVPQEPIVPAGPSDDELRDALVEEAFAEDEIINPLGGAPAIGAQRQIADSRTPFGLSKIEGFMDINIPAAASHQKGRSLMCDGFDGSKEVVKQENVAIDMAEQIMARGLLGMVVDAREVFSAVGVLSHGRQMANAKLAASLGGSGVVAKKKYFHVGM